MRTGRAQRFYVSQTRKVPAVLSQVRSADVSIELVVFILFTGHPTLTIKVVPSHEVDPKAAIEKRRAKITKITDSGVREAPVQVWHCDSHPRPTAAKVLPPLYFVEIRAFS